MELRYSPTRNVNWSVIISQSLSSRTDAIHTFLARCEAKLSVLEASRRDMEYSDRLAALSQRAGDVIGEAQHTVQALGKDFVLLAYSISEALQIMEREWLSHTAADVPVSDIESVADQILAAGHDGERQLQQLVDAMF
jgi:hypothetical protein